MTQSQRQHRFAVILAFGLVYFFWGSTYLGIDIAVEKIPPALMCGVRFLISGVLMVTYCGLTGRTIRYSPRQLGQMAAVGVLLLMGGNLTLSYAERHVPSGLAALIVAITPLWFLIFDSLLLGDHHISVRGKIGLVVGMAGLVVLLWPELTMPFSLQHAELWSSLSLIFGSGELGVRFGIGETLEVGGSRSLFRHGLADDRRRRGQHAVCHRRWRLWQSGLDFSWNRRRNLSDHLRIMDWLHRLYLVAGATYLHRKFRRMPT